MRLPRITNFGRGEHGIRSGEFDGKSGSISMIISRICSFGAGEHRIWEGGFEWKSIGIAMGVSRIGDRGGGERYSSVDPTYFVR